MSSNLLAGRYELIEKIGEGGMAVVYKAKDRLLNRYIAVKILRPEFTKDTQFIENFKKESQAAAGLQHPNIVSVYDVGREGNIHYIVMELIDGRPLSDIIKEQAPMNYKDAIEITKQVASALSLAHKNHIVHRDVKPHNIMITSSGLAKLADFGIAKAVSDSTLVSETSKIIGSVHYFSPEQARGAYVDERSDIYSLGIVLYEMLTGQVPFDGDNPVQVALMHINDDIIPPSRLVSGIPPALEKLVMKATDKFQSNRYKTADEMLEDLDNIEFVTKMVGNAVFAASDVEEFRNMNKDNNNETTDLPLKSAKKKKQISDEERSSKKKRTAIVISVIIGVLLLGLIVFGLFKFGIIGGNSGDIEVPDLTNYTYADAEKELNDLGLEIKKGDDVPSADVDENKIASQDPVGGTKVQKGSIVTVNISTGKESNVVPNLEGMMYTSRASLDEYLSKYGYSLGNVSEEESDYDEGTIIYQTPEPNTEAEKGTAIDITVSSGKKPEMGTVPQLTGLTVEEAKKAIKDSGFEEGDITFDDSNVYAKNYVMWQQYSPGEKIEKGTKISFTISNGAPVVTPPDPDPDPETPESDDSE